MELLHIYAQDSWHQDATIVGNRAALEKLLGAVQLALDMGQGGAGSVEAFVNDGEGYECLVKLYEDDALWAQLATPYTDEMCQGANG